jgi:hypothetical protein
LIQPTHPAQRQGAQGINADGDNADKTRLKKTGKPMSDVARQETSLFLTSDL